MYSLEELDKIVARSVSSVCGTAEPENLYAPIRYMMSIGGKRIRPKMCLLVYSLFHNEIGKEVLYPALSLEMFHEFTLVHDDIMDRSETRRGNLTVYRKWSQNTAILSGDVMSIAAYDLLSCASDKYLRKAMEIFTKMAVEVCEGQQYDMDYEDMPFITMDDYMKMIGRKTAVLIACSAKMGALLSGAEESACDALYEFGYQLGLAFQITDDYLDTFGNEKTFGKKIGGDIINNKKTWLLVEAFRLAGADRKKELSSILSLGPERSVEKIERMQKLYIDLGVKNAASAAAEECHSKAMAALDTLSLNESQRELLNEFARELTSRDK
ncbi:MAG: polyprenyl synthetase family protein [Bacteroidales bacterium]|nr:polyprenyl synthetase family protein [Candidatus Cacconaster merdequi]